MISSPRRRAPALAVPAAALAVLTVTPATGTPAAAAAPAALAAALGAPPATGRAAPRGRPRAAPFAGTPAVGALLVRRHGRLAHFCTASVVRSRHGNLLITAAHCLAGRRLGRGAVVVFAPGYYNGRFPRGRWIVRRAFTDRQWREHRDPDDDVAFLLAGRPGRRIEKYTGAETLVTGARLPQRVRVIGYPDTSARPVSCAAPARVDPGRRRQLVFRCGGYTGGTSGGPFLARISRARGTGALIGVIGGYQQGGATPGISYSARFGARVAALYHRAER